MSQGLDVAALLKKNTKPVTIESSHSVFKIDTGNLLIFDYQTLSHLPNKDPQEWTRNSMQELINNIFNLPTNESQVGPIAQLPPGKTLIPREKPAPKAKPLTKWEKYAKEKGIVKKKRSRLVFDETTETYRPRFGRGRINDPKDDWALEDNPTKQKELGARDPFELRDMLKKQKSDKQKRNEAVNRKRRDKDSNKALPGTLDVTINSPQNQKHTLKRAIAQTQKSTASVGVFDAKVKKEPKIHRKPKSVNAGGKQEKVEMLKIMDRVLKRAEPKVDKSNAANVLKQKEEFKRAKAKRGMSVNDNINEY